MREIFEKIISRRKQQRRENRRNHEAIRIFTNIFNAKIKSRHSLKSLCGFARKKTEEHAPRHFLIFLQGKNNTQKILICAVPAKNLR